MTGRTRPDTGRRPDATQPFDLRDPHPDLFGPAARLRLDPDRVDLGDLAERSSELTSVFCNARLRSDRSDGTNPSATPAAMLTRGNDRERW